MHKTKIKENGDLSLNNGFLNSLFFKNIILVRINQIHHHMHTHPQTSTLKQPLTIPARFSLHLSHLYYLNPTKKPNFLVVGNFKKTFKSSPCLSWFEKKLNLQLS